MLDGQRADHDRQGAAPSWFATNAQLKCVAQVDGVEARKAGEAAKQFTTDDRYILVGSDIEESGKQPVWFRRDDGEEIDMREMNVEESKQLAQR